MKDKSNPTNLTHSKHLPSLVLKDSLRELRLNAKRTAQAFTAELENAATQFPPVIGKPLGAAARAATQALQFADRKVIELLSPDTTVKLANLKLLQPLSLFEAINDIENLSQFTNQYYLTAKTLLQMKEQPDFYIREQAIYEAYFNFKERCSLASEKEKIFEDGFGHPSWSSLISSFIILSLLKERPVTYIHATTIDDIELIEKISTLNLQICASIVLASEIADLFQQFPKEQETKNIIKLAAEIISARMETWDSSIHGPYAHYRTAREIDFIMRHI